MDGDRPNGRRMSARRVNPGVLQCAKSTTHAKNREFWPKLR